MSTRIITPNPDKPELKIEDLWYSIYFYSAFDVKYARIRLYPLTDFLFFMLKISDVCKKDGATRGASGCAARTTLQL
jgi:hypothetical protein